MRFQKGRIAGVASILFLVAGGAFADIIVFNDGFESYSTGGDRLNWEPPEYPNSPWILGGGSIDIVQSGNWGLYASVPPLGAPEGDIMDGGSFFLDMDGSTNQGGTLMSMALDQIGGVIATPGPFTPLVPHQYYTVEFIMAGNQRINAPDTAEFGVVLESNGQLNQLSSWTLARNAPWTHTSTPKFLFHTGDQIYFRNLGGDNQGFLLDNVRITTTGEMEQQAPGVVPEPASLSVLGMGIVGLIASRMRRKRA